jgi:hypothetical protein
MYSILLALVATTALMTPPVTRGVMVQEAMPQAAESRPAAPVPARDARRAGRITPDRETDEERVQRLEKLWIPLPCTRVGMRMVC